MLKEIMLISFNLARDMELIGRMHPYNAVERLTACFLKLVQPTGKERSAIRHSSRREASRASCLT